MAPSQLKRLKSSLRQAGLVGQQKPSGKKGKKTGGTGSESRVERSIKLQNIREEFNPFDLKQTKQKWEVSGREKQKGVKGQPGISKQAGEDERKRTLLVEMQRRNKVGGIVDRRIGENDPTMAPEDRMLERFTREKQRGVRAKDAEMYNLEDDEEVSFFGHTLGGLGEEDFAEEDLVGSDSEKPRGAKRLLGSDEEGSGDENAPARKKSKAEVMKEVMAKSKLFKYERQKAKEEDDDVREALDKDLGSLRKLLMQSQPKMNADRLAQMTGEKNEVEKAYDQAFGEMMFDKRAAPADRTKTAEEKAAEEAERLRKLEEARLKRMRGEEDSDVEMEKADRKRERRRRRKDKDESESESEKEEVDEDDEEGEAEHFGFGKKPVYDPNPNPDEIVEDEYMDAEEVDFDDDELDGMLEKGDANQSDDYDSDVSMPENEEDSEDEFIADLKEVEEPKKAESKAVAVPEDESIGYTYPCPATHEEFLQIIKDVPVETLPTVVRRIRVLHHASLMAGNKEKLEKFAQILLDHIGYMAETLSPVPWTTMDTLVRHLHSMAKQYPQSLPQAFRERINQIEETRPTDLKLSDFVMLNNIGIIFPTSDNHHHVVTPTILCMARYLNQAAPKSLTDLAKGAYVCSLFGHYVKLSKRFVPEVLNYIYQGLTLLAPTSLKKLPGTYPLQNPTDSLRIKKTGDEWTFRRATFADLKKTTLSKSESNDLAHTLLAQFTSLLAMFSNLWAGKTAFFEAFEPGKLLLQHLLKSKSTEILAAPALTLHLRTVLNAIEARLQKAHLTRRPLELHHHRPLPIPSNIPKFQENFSLDKKSYDPDRERVEAAKLKAEYKKERKGALRELRKDSAFIAREKLREEKVASREYHAKMKKLTAMIQTEEGQASNEYEREKRARKGKK
ncbi:Nop14-like protein [Ascobolus immersus RN42]|uniref:Nop14-like protein n=1 Tax=Ascobolus immersus RN42 TaxID=1160509 RepID=A0A3N4I5J7_ASCIM|nr:Nop14-like protein [Ascobolus immersus RN42]